MCIQLRLWRGGKFTMQLVFSIRQLQEAPLDLDFSFNTSEICERMPDLVNHSQPSEVHGCVHVEKLRGSIVVEGTVEGVLFAECSRCLEAVRISPDRHFRLVLLPRPDFPKDEIPLAEDDLDTAYYTGEQIDLSSHLWDHVILSIPQQPLCSPDCKGIEFHVPGVAVDGDFACESGFSVLKTLSLSPSDPEDPGAKTR